MLGLVPKAKIQLHVAFSVAFSPTNTHRSCFNTHSTMKSIDRGRQGKAREADLCICICAAAAIRHISPPFRGEAVQLKMNDE